MAKTVFRPNEVKQSEDLVHLQLSRKFVEEEPVEEIIEAPVYEGPTADDLRREAEIWKENWEREKESRLEESREEADRILKDAEKAAFDEVKRKTDQAQVIRQQALDEAAEIKNRAEEEARRIVSEAEASMNERQKTGYEDGFKRGQEDGFKEGNLEAQRLTDRLHTIIERMMDKRQEILRITSYNVCYTKLLRAKRKPAPGSLLNGGRGRIGRQPYQGKIPCHAPRRLTGRPNGGNYRAADGDALL